ncbi:MAG: hypothetical protein U9N59_07810 [Campylobacterota bacterium]|nr:hypothetical protein [Campylobacterota bacterium]
MQKIKYIIIFTLLLALGLLYVQLSDYDKITNTLLNENSSSYDKITKLQNKITLLESENIELNNNVSLLKDENLNLNSRVTTLQDKIISMDETISISKLPIQENILDETNETISSALDIHQEILLNSNNNTFEEEQDIKVEPKITLDDQNKITGFGLEYKENF